MINIIQKGSFQGRGLSLGVWMTSGGQCGAMFSLGLNVPFFGLFDTQPDRVIDHVYTGSRWTSQQKALAMHDCRHQTMKGDLYIPATSQLVPPITAVSRVDYQPSSSHRIERPLNGVFYTGPEAKSKKMWKSYSGTVSSMAPDTNPGFPYASLPAWTAFSSTAPNWQTYPDRDFAATNYLHYQSLGSRVDGVQVIGVTQISYNEIVRNYFPVAYEVRSQLAIMACIPDGLKLVTYYYNPSKGLWSTSRYTQPFALTSDEAKNLMLSGSGLPIPGFPPFDVSHAPIGRPATSWSGSIEVSCSSPSYSKTDVREYLSDLSVKLAAVPCSSWDFRELHDDVMDAIQFVDINSIAYLAEIKKVGDTLRALLSFLKGRIDKKSAASLWLSLRYGDRLTVLDSVDILRGASQVSKRSLNANGFLTSRIRRQRSYSVSFIGSTFAVRQYAASSLYYRDADLGAICNGIRSLMEWDLWPSLANAWDLIPFSFVVDWFVRIEDLMRAVDRRIQSQYYDIAAVCDGCKTEIVVPERFNPQGLTGQLIWSRYTRNISNQLSFSPFRTDAGHSSTINVVDGISLLVQATS